MKHCLIIRESITDVKNTIKSFDRKNEGKYINSNVADYVYTFRDFTIHGFVIRTSDDTKSKIFRLNDFYDYVDAVDFGNSFYNHYIFVRSVSRANGVPIDKVVIKKVLSKKLREKAKWK